MSSVLQTEQVVEAATKFIESTFGAKAAILIPGDNELLTMHDGNAISRGIDLRGAAQWAYDKSQPAGAGTDTLPASEFLYLPLRAPMRTRWAPARLALLSRLTKTCTT